MLWYSAQTRLDKDLLNDDVILETSNKVINMAVETSCMFFFYTNTNAKNLFHESTNVHADDLHRRLGSET